MGALRYAPEFFNRATVQEAKGVILTPEGGMTVEERWRDETAWLMERITFPPGGIVVDYGCGIGRMAKALARPVIGVDISFDMLDYAVKYVRRTDFVAMSPVAFAGLVESGFRASGALAVWSLQHVLDLDDAVKTLMHSLRPGAPFWMLDLCTRCVPLMNGDQFVMGSDGRNVLAALESWCDLEHEQPLDVWKQTMPNSGKLCRFRRR